MKPTDVKVTPSFSRTAHPMLTLIVTQAGAERQRVSFTVHMLDMKTRGWLASILKRQIRDIYISGYNSAKDEAQKGYEHFMASMDRCRGMY